MHDPYLAAALAHRKARLSEMRMDPDARYNKQKQDHLDQIAKVEKQGRDDQAKWDEAGRRDKQEFKDKHGDEHTPFKYKPKLKTVTEQHRGVDMEAARTRAGGFSNYGEYKDAMAVHHGMTVRAFQKLNPTHTVEHIQAGDGDHHHTIIAPNGPGVGVRIHTSPRDHLDGTYSSDVSEYHQI